MVEARPCSQPSGILLHGRIHSFRPQLKYSQCKAHTSYAVHNSPRNEYASARMGQHTVRGTLSNVTEYRDMPALLEWGALSSNPSRCADNRVGRIQDLRAVSV